MSFDIVNLTLASDLANSGTVTINYPTGRTKGDYTLGQSGLHILVAGQNKYVAPTNFTLTFNVNASNITLTNTNMGTIKAGTVCILQCERFDTDDKVSLRVSPPAVGSGSPPNNLSPARPFLIDLGSPNALNTSGICASQSVTAATAALLNGTGTDVTASSDGLSVTLNTPRNVTAAWTTTSVCTVKGTDVYGNVMSEASASGTSMTGKKAFKTITNITFSISVTSCTVGYGDVLGLPVAVHNGALVAAEIIGASQVGGAPRKTRVYWSLNQVDLLAGSTNSVQIQAPFTGIVTKVGSIVRKAITTGGTLTFKDATTSMVGATITIADSAAQGAAQNVTPTAGDASLVVTKNDQIQVVPASFATAGEVDGYIEFTPTGDALITGTLVIAEVLKATTTTGDVRGTYKPELATDGTTGIALVVWTLDPTDIGSPQI